MNGPPFAQHRPLDGEPVLPDVPRSQEGMMFRKAAGRVLQTTRAAIDLASIMVGVLVIGLIAGVISATVFAVIPWAQDRAAEGDLDAVKTAQSAYRVQNGEYSTALGELVNGDPGIGLFVGTNCYSAFTASKSGKTFYITSNTGTPAEVPAVWPATAPDGYPTACEWPKAVTAATATPITNFIRNPDYAQLNQGTGTSRTQFANGGPGGSTYNRFTVTAASTVDNRGPFNSMDSDEKLDPSKTYTGSSWIRSSIPLQVMPGMEKYNADSARIGSVYNGTVTLTPNVWTRVHVTTAPTVNVARLNLTVYAVNTAFPVGATIDSANFMLTEGPELHSYADGTTPGWKWTGTPWSSYSTGRPYTLESIAGAPMVNVTTESATSISGGALDGFTSYVAYTAKAPTAEWTSLIFMGAKDINWERGGYTYQRRDAELTTDHVRFATSANNNQLGTTLTDNKSWLEGNHIAVHTMQHGLTAFTSMIDNRPDSTRDVLPGTGIPREMFKVRVAVSSPNGVASTQATVQHALYYTSSHDRATRLAVTKWLANENGTSVNP